MTRITSRSLATAAITGALVVGTAGLAQADDSRSSDSASQRESATELGAPVEFGGVTLTNESSSSDTRQDATTDGDESSSTSSSRTSDGAQELHFGAFSFDPSFIYEAAEAQRESEQSTDDGEDVNRSEQNESASRTDGSAPVTIGGSSGSVEQHDTSSDSATQRDGDESETTSDSSEQHSKQGFDFGDTKTDPLFGNEQGEKDSLVESILN